MVKKGEKKVVTKLCQCGEPSPANTRICRSCKQRFPKKTHKEFLERRREDGRRAKINKAKAVRQLLSSAYFLSGLEGMQVTVMAMCPSAKRIQYYSTVEYDRNIVASVGNVASKISPHNSNYEMFVKINEEESEDEGSDQETNGQLEMDSRHSENYGQTESDVQTENRQTESDGRAENGQAENGQTESDGQAENGQAENGQMESEKDTTGLDNSPGPLEGTDDMYVVERIVGEVKRDGKKYYMVKWKGYDESENSEITARDAKKLVGLFSAYKTEQKERKKAVVGKKVKNKKK